MALDLDDRRPVYLQIADELRRAIRSGDYQAGDRLPAVRMLAEQYGTATATAAKAIDLLRQEGVVTSRPGLGTVVRDTAMAVAPSLQEQVQDLRRRVEALEESADRK